MKRSHIFLVGKPYPLSEAAAAIKRMGYKVGILLDKNIPLKDPESYDLILPLDFSSPQTAVKDLQKYDVPAAGLICTYENYIVTKAHLCRALDLPSIEPDYAKWCTDKLLMRQAFLRANPDITPRFGLVDKQQQLLDLASKLTYPLMIKPTNLAKSLLVMRCNSQSELLKNFDYAQANISKLYEKHKIYNRSPQLIVEEYITGKMFTVAAFVDSEGRPHFCDGVAALTTAQDIGKNDNYLFARQLPAQLDPDLEAQLFDVAHQGIAALKMTSSAAHIEMINSSQGVKIIEIGARIGGYRPRMYNISYGINLIEAEIMLALGKKPLLNTRQQAFSAVYELFPDREGLFQGIDGRIPKNGLVSLRVTAKKNDRAGAARQGHKAAAICVVQAPNRSELSILDTQIRKLSVAINSAI